MFSSEPLGEVQLGETFQLRLTLALYDLHLEDERHLVIPVQGTRPLEVRYRRPTADEQSEDAEPKLSLGDTICTVIGTWRVSPANREHLEKLAREGAGELTRTVVVWGVVPNETGMRAWDALPQSLRDMLDAGMTELGGAAHRTLRLIRWRRQLPGEPNPFRQWGFTWSPDGKSWQHLPWKTPLHRFRCLLHRGLSRLLRRGLLDAGDVQLRPQLRRDP